MQTLIDKVRVAPATNIPTVGFNTLLALVVNGASGASNYTGTQAEADALEAGSTITVADNASGTGAVEIDAQYVKFRTQAGTKNAFLEIVLADAYITAITLPTDVTVVARYLTLPAHSEV